MAKFPKELKSVGGQDGEDVKIKHRLAMGKTVPGIGGNMGVRSFDNPNGDAAKPMPDLKGPKSSNEEI